MNSQTKTVNFFSIHAETNMLKLFYKNSIICHLYLNIGQQGKWLKDSVMQGAIICSQATVLFVLKREKWTGKENREGARRNKWTHLLPKALFFQLIYQKQKKNSF